MKVECCFICCHKDADYEIWDGQEPCYDHKTQSCVEHVGELLSDTGKPNQVYPIKQG